MCVEGEIDEGRSRSSSDGDGNNIDAVSREGKDSPVTGGDTVPVIGRDYSRTSGAVYDMDLEAECDGEGEASGRGFYRNTSSSSVSLGAYHQQPAAGFAASSKESISRNTLAYTNNNTNSAVPSPPGSDSTPSTSSSSHKDHFILSWSALQHLNWDIIFLLGPS